MPEGATRWLKHPIKVSHLDAGSLSAAGRLLLHVGTTLTSDMLPECDTDEGSQGWLAFNLPGWDLILAETEEWTEDEHFPFIIQAAPQTYPMTIQEIELLQRRLFLMLSFIAGTEVNIGLTTGLDSANQVVWGSWITPRYGTGQWRWCSERLVVNALPDLAEGALKRSVHHCEMIMVVH
jgi:hypothetical protein